MHMPKTRTCYETHAGNCYCSDITPKPTITRMAVFEAVGANYEPVSSGWTTRKGAVSSCIAHGAARVIQGGYDTDGNRYFREVHPRITRTWQERFQPHQVAR